MKAILIFPVFLLAINLIATDYSGTWEINTLNQEEPAKIISKKDNIQIHRTLKLSYEGKPYLLHHLMKGKLSDKQLKLYVKDDSLQAYEYLRKVDFNILDSNTLKIDRKHYKRLKSNKVALIKQPSKTLQKSMDNKDKKIEIIYTKKKASPPLFPAGLGDQKSKTIKISLGFNQDEQAINSRAIHMLKAKNYDKALRLFLQLYSKKPKNLSLLIKIESTYSLIGKKKEASMYCNKIKKYDPFYLCGG